MPEIEDRNLESIMSVHTPAPKTPPSRMTVIKQRIDNTPFVEALDETRLDIEQFCKHMKELAELRCKNYDLPEEREEEKYVDTPVYTIFIWYQT